MDTVLIAAAIGLIGTVLGAVIQAFGPSLFRAWPRGRHARNGVEGKWLGTWKVRYPDRKKATVSDVVHLKELRRGMLEGEGDVSLIGKYKLSGKVSDYCTVISFNGIKDKEQLAGVALLKRFPAKDHMEGHWVQLHHDGDMLGGFVTFTKDKS